MNGIRFWCYNAGHVLGAAMFMIEIAGVKILYTGLEYQYEDFRSAMTIPEKNLVTLGVFGIISNKRVQGG